MTGPDELRKDADWYDPHPCVRSMREAADAWEKDIAYDNDEMDAMRKGLFDAEHREAALRKRLEAAVEKFNAYHQEVTALVPEEWEPGTTWEHAPESCEICAFLVAALAGRKP